MKERTCNRTACRKPGATYWNVSTRAWYCRECAKAINEGVPSDYGPVCFSENSLPPNEINDALLTALKVVVDDWTSQFEKNGHLAPEWCKQARLAIEKTEEHA